MLRSVWAIAARQPVPDGNGHYEMGNEIMTSPVVLLQDMHEPARVADATADTVTDVLAGWLTDDGIPATSRLVRNLVSALRNSDWTAVHNFADQLAVGVTVIETADERRRGDRAAALVWADEHYSDWADQ